MAGHVSLGADMTLHTRHGRLRESSAEQQVNTSSSSVA